MDRDELHFQIKRGLTSSPKYIPAWFTYEKEGSEIYTSFPIENPHYYSYNAEIEILKERSQEVVDDLPTPCALVDLGCGTGIKTKYLIDAFLRKQGYLHYIPVDICEEYFKDMCKARLSEYGDKIHITQVQGVYETGIQAMRDIDSAKLIVWLCGMQNTGYQRQIEYLKFFHDHMSEQDRLIISADTTEDESKVKLSYDHADLQLKLDFTGNERLYLHEGEGVSCKYNTTQLQSLIRKGNFHLHKTWRDNERHMAFVCLKKVE